MRVHRDRGPRIDERDGAPNVLYGSSDVPFSNRPEPRSGPKPTSAPLASPRRRLAARCVVVGWTLVATALLPWSAGCGGSQIHRAPVDIPPQRDDDPGRLVEQQTADAAELERLMARPEVDCLVACELVARICSLEDRICAIAARHEDDPETSERCADASVRCATAGTRAAEQCTCEPADESS